MEPVLQRLGDVTIQRLEKPKEPKPEPPANPSLDTAKNKEENETSDESFNSDEESFDEYDDHMENPSPSKPFPTQPQTPQTLKRSFPPPNLNLGPEISFKKFRVDTVTKNEGNPEGKKIEEEFELNLSDDEISEYDSELESEGELQDLGDEIGLGLDLGLGTTTKTEIGKQEARTTAPPTIKQEVDEEGPGASSFFEKLVEGAEIPPITPSTPSIKNESTDEDYDVDIKEKLKEMGEITFASVKKGDKPKNSESGGENEVVITKKTGEEVTVMSKGNLRRNIREVMDESKLDESTLAAQRQEAERLRRVQEQQRILREYQKQAQQERMQQRVMSLLQGNNFSKPGTSNQTRIGNTVLVKLPNGQTKPMTKVPRPPFDLLKMPRPEVPQHRFPHHGPSMMGPMSMMGAPRGHFRGPPPNRKMGVQLPSSVSLAPLSKRGPPLMPTRPHHSDSDSESEEMKSLLSPPPKPSKVGKHSDTIEVSSDDDCIVVSESEGDQGADDEDQDDPSNSGMHTNDEFNQPDEQGRVLVNVGHAEDEPDVFVAPQIARIIKPHQIGGVRFLYDNIVESINRFDSSAGFGCILAHSMGLGKTLQIVTFSDVFLRYTPSKTILCIMPINTLQNWLAEYNMWTPTEETATLSPLNSHGEVRPRNFKLFILNDSHKTLVARHRVIKEWKAQGGVLLIGYDQFRLLSMKKNPKTKRKMPVPEVQDDHKNKPIFDDIYSSLVNPGPDLVICDEGHRIKNSHASISAALKQLRTKRRVVLTGYPLQNNLTEYWCMVDFVRPNYLGSKTEFLNMFERPIMNGQCIDSTEADIKLMRYRAHVLHSLLVGFVQRRSHMVLQTVLPQKEEYVLLIRFTTFQRKVYDTFMNEIVRKQAVPNPLKAFAVCCKIWNHPDVLYNFLMKRSKEDVAVDLDIEEVANTVSGVTTTNETKPRKKPPGKPRKAPAKGRNGKPAASVTPYNSNIDPTQPSSIPNGMPPTSQATQSQFNTTCSFSNPPKTGGESNYGPYVDEFNQPRTSFEGISQFFDDHMSQSSFDRFSPSFGQSTSSLLNLDSQNTVTVTNSNSKPVSMLPNLPSGISLTPLGSRNQSNVQNQLPPSPELMDVNSVPKPNYSGANAQQMDNYGTNNFGTQPFWDGEKKTGFGQQGTFNTLSTPSWLKKEENCSNDSKPKINIISDIKLPPVFTPDKKIKILSDIKIEPKKEDDKYGVNRELEKIKNEIKNELKIEDDVKPSASGESPLVRLGPLKEPKEDNGIPYDWAVELFKDYIPGLLENSSKFQILFCIINESIALGDRLLIFSQSLMTLDSIEQFLQAREVPGETYKWAKNASYYRLDGSTGAQEREKLINEFNSNPKIHVFMVSTRAGSLGINLVGANRVVVLDASWNPCHDTQAICRVYRYGQRKPCFVYRLVVDNCLEKKIYDRQVSKQGMSDRVVDECNPDAHLTMKDVSTLCFDEKGDEAEIKDWSAFKNSYIDVVLQKVLDRHGTGLTKEPFQHESLLVDRKEKQLSQQEKRLAKKGYEREKNASRQPAYLGMGTGRGHRPVASVRPMQQGERPSRWIPAEHWQRQGMTAQEMTLPLDVVIPTNQPEKGNIVLKAGQKVLVLKSPKGVYMQLESGKIVAIKTAIKVKGKAEENDPMKQLIKSPQMKSNPPQPVIPQKRPPKPPPSQLQMPFLPGMTKFNVKSVQKTVPNLVSKIQSVNKKVQNMTSKPKPYQVGGDIAKQLREAEPGPSSSSEDEHPVGGSEKAPPTQKPETSDELEKRISQLKKNISIQRVTTQGVKQPISSPQAASSALQQQQQQAQQSQLHKGISKESQQQKLQPVQKTPTQDKVKAKIGETSILDRLGKTAALENTPFQETLDSITAGFKNPDNMNPMDSDEEDEDEEREPLDEEEEEEENLPDSAFMDPTKQMEQNEGSDQSDDVTYVSEQLSDSSTGRQADYSATGSGFNYNYNYNMPPYQGHPPPQGYAYPPQHPPSYDGYSAYPPQPTQAPYNYGYQGYPPHQPHYAPPPPQPAYDYNNPSAPQPVYPSYNPYPQQYAPPPQGLYPPPPTPTAPTTYDYSQYPTQTQSTGYYPNT